MLRDFSTSSTFVDSTISLLYQLLNSHSDSSVRSTVRMCHTPLSVFTCHPFACTILRTGLLILLATPSYCPYCCKGIKRTSAPSKSVPRKPITTSTLGSLKSSLKSADIPHSHYLLYWAAFSLAFYGFLRVGEYTAPTRFSTNARTLLARHLLLAADSLTISLPSSKASQFAPPAPIHIGATSSSMCPVQAMRRFLRSRRAHCQHLCSFSLMAPFCHHG